MSEATFIIGCRACDDAGVSQREVQVSQSEMPYFKPTDYHHVALDASDFEAGADHGWGDLYVVSAEGVPSDIVTEKFEEMAEVALFLEGTRDAATVNAFYEWLRQGQFGLSRDSTIWFMSHYVGTGDSFAGLLGLRFRNGFPMYDAELDAVPDDLRAFMDIDAMIRQGYMDRAYTALNTGTGVHVFSVHTHR